MSRADRVVSRKVRRAGKQAAFDRYVKRSGAQKLTGRRGDLIIIDDPTPPNLYINPAWRWYHGDNHLLDENTGRCKADGCPRTFRGFHGGILGDRNEIWFGLPKPRKQAWSPALRLAERFYLVRDRAWLTALGPTPNSKTLAEAQANMPGWAHLFAFHAFTAAWLALPELEQVVVLDAWEDLNPPAHAWVLPAPPSMSADLEKHTAIPP
jgi:hypothetical protein